MSRLAQFGLFCVVLVGVILFLSLFPSSIDVDNTPGIGLVQIVLMQIGLVFLVLGAYLFVYATIHRGRPRTLMRDIAVRLGMTGLVFSAAAMMADVMGFGSHTTGAGPLFGWLQATGMLIGFAISAIGVFLYGAARS